MPLVLGLVLGIVLGAAVAAATWMVLAFNDVSASSEHRAATLRLLESGLRESVQRRARTIEVPRLDDPALAARGLALYREHCAQCHGAPGVAPAPFALGMRPLPANLAHTAREWSAAELFWTVKHGIKWTGMPAWEFRMTDQDIWAVVAFLRELPTLTPQRYRELEAPKTVRAAPPSAPPDAARGRRALSQYACTACHQIPGVVDRDVPVGPPLAGVGTREFLAGVVPNTPENMVNWLLSPQKVNPRTAMPELGLTERDARDIAAYLSTLQ